MMKRIGFLLLFIFTTNFLFGQDTKITFSIISPATFKLDGEIKMVSTEGTKILTVRPSGTVGNVIAEHTFTSSTSYVDLEIDLVSLLGGQPAIPEYHYTLIYGFSGSSPCANYDFVIQTTDGSLNVPITMRINWSPTTFNLSPSPAPSNNVLCETSPISITATDYEFASYTWQYKKETTGTWRTISFSNNKLSGSVKGFINESLDPIETDKPYFFRAKIGSCTYKQVGPYFFGNTPLKATAHTGQAPRCSGESNGGFTLTGFNRSMYASESSNNFVMTVYKSNGSTVVGQFNFSSIPTGGLVVNSSVLGGSNLFPAGNYKVQIEHEDFCGSVVSQYSVAVPAKSAISFTASSVNPQCNGGKGTINITGVSGGNGGYRYSLDGSNYGTSASFTNQSPGNYTAYVKDNKGCVSTRSASISAPSAISYSGFNLLSEPDCFDSSNGSIEIQASGGTGTLRYSTSSSSGYSTNPVINGLSKGSHTIYIKDANNCKINRSVTVTGPNQIVGSITLTDPLCTGEQSGQISVSSSGGSGSKQYALDGVNYQSSGVFTRGAGSYVVYIKDANGCVRSYNRTLTDPSALGFGLVASNVSCAGGSDGSITVNNVVNTTGNVSYILNGGASTQSSPVFTGLPAGSHNISIRDDNCTSATQYIAVSEQPAMTAQFHEDQPISCAGGSDGILRVSLSNGSPGYSYLWSSGETTASISNKPAGAYSVVATDSKGCNKTFHYTLSAPSPLVPYITAKDFNGNQMSCAGANDAELTAFSTGGTGPFTFRWSTGALTSKITGLSAGSYTVEIEDSRGCTENKTYEIIAPEAVSITNSSTSDVVCFGSATGSINLSVTGGNGVYAYSLDGTTWLAGSQINGLISGNYTVHIRDENFCTVRTDVSINSPSELEIQLVGLQETTCGRNDGALEVVGQGGIPGYSYEWRNSSNQVVGNVATITSLSPDLYAVLITDGNGCTTSQQYLINSSDGPQISTGQATDISCFGGEDGTIELSITHGVAPYTINWNNGMSGSTITGLSAGAYLAEVSDQTGCVVVYQVQLTEPTPIELTSSNTVNPSCFGNNNGSVALDFTGGTGSSYNVTWPDGSTAMQRDDLSAGDYNIEVRDAIGCSNTITVAITDPEKFVIDMSTSFQTCPGAPLTINPGYAGSYQWSGPDGFSSTDPVVEIAQEGSYRLEIENMAGCIDAHEFTLEAVENLLNAEFLIASEVYAGDTLVVIDISWPMPERVEWSLPVGAQVLEQTKDYIYFIMDVPGEYSLGLQAEMGGCGSYALKNFTVLDASLRPTKGGKLAAPSEEVLSKLDVYPNPTTGPFSIQMELNKEQVIRLQLVRLSNNEIILDKETANTTKHLERVNQKLPPGMYILLVEVEGKTYARKILVR